MSDDARLDVGALQRWLVEVPHVVDERLKDEFSTRRAVARARQDGERVRQMVLVQTRICVVS